MAGKKKKTAKRSPSKRKTTGKPVDVSATMDDGRRPEPPSLSQALENAQERLNNQPPLSRGDGIDVGSPIVSAKDIPSGGGFLGVPMVLADHEEKLVELKTELAELKTKFAEMEKMFYLPGPEGGADEV